MNFEIFIGQFGMSKFSDFHLKLLETLTFMYFRGIIYSNKFITLPHNVDYVALILHPHKSQSLHLSTVNISIFNRVNSGCVDVTVPKNISKTNNIFLQ